VQAAVPALGRQSCCVYLSWFLVIHDCTYSLVANFKLPCVLLILEYCTKDARDFRIVRSQHSQFSMTTTYAGEHWIRTVRGFSIFPGTTSKLSFYSMEAMVQVTCSSFHSARQLILIVEFKEYQISGDADLTDLPIVSAIALPTRLFDPRLVLADHHHLTNDHRRLLIEQSSQYSASWMRSIAVC